MNIDSNNLLSWFYSLLCMQASLSKSAMKRQSPSHHYDDGGAAKRVTWHNDHVSSSDSDAEQQRAVVYTLDDYRAMVK